MNQLEAQLVLLFESDLHFVLNTVTALVVVNIFMTVFQIAFGYLHHSLGIALSCRWPLVCHACMHHLKESFPALNQAICCVHSCVQCLSRCKCKGLEIAMIVIVKMA